MSNLVIVAIPEATDYVWRISSEKVPHMTLLYLGENGDHIELNKITAFVQHAASLTLNRFGMEVNHRGTLGDDEADVLFFEKDNWEYPKIRDFRSQLLMYDPIRTAHDRADDRFADQEWIPHLTLGYPDKPAKKGRDEFEDRFYYVQFDRIAIWNEEYDGLEIQLERYRHPEIAMNATEEAGQEFLAHFGVKGMHWGVRKSPAEREAVLRALRPAKETTALDTIGVSSKHVTKIKTKGGEDHPASSDAIKVAKSRQKLQKSGTHALSNQELKDVAERLNLEQQVNRLSPRRASLGDKFIKTMFKDPASQFIATKAADPFKTYQEGQAAYTQAKPFIDSLFAKKK